MRFPDEIVFHESIKESDGEAVIRMLRRVSVDIDINRITMSGMTAIHQVRCWGRLELHFKQLDSHSHFSVEQTGAVIYCHCLVGGWLVLQRYFTISKFIKVNFGNCWSI